MAIKVVRPESVAPALLKALGDRRQGVDTSELLVAIVDQWGGVVRLAEDLRLEYDASKAGSITRQRILQMIQQLIVVATEREHHKPRRASDMTDEELQRFALSMSVRVAEATTQEEPPPTEGDSDGLEGKVE
jgi:hypothetical protein